VGYSTSLQIQYIFLRMWARTATTRRHYALAGLRAGILPTHLEVQAVVA
jgi:hypothetical protein